MTTHITPERIAELLALDVFEYGPWRHDLTDYGVIVAANGMQVAEAIGDYGDPGECVMIKTHADFIAAAPELHAALAQVNAENERLRAMLDRHGIGPAERYWEGRWRTEAAENERLRYLIREGCDLLAVEIEALREGISIGGQMCPGPEDQRTVDAINEIEDWIARAHAAIGEFTGDPGVSDTEGLREAVAICKAVRKNVCEGEPQAIGAMECALAIQDAINCHERAAKESALNSEGEA